MATPDLSKLTISREQKAFSGKKGGRRKWWIIGIVAIVLVGAAVAMSSGGGAVQVESGIVASAYPSQAITALNATGRVTAQRKAAVSTKATGRLEFLGVQEGSIVKAGDVLARIENRDVSATQDQAQASLRAAKANLEQGMAELRDAESNLKRSEDLANKNFISSATLDGAKARYDKAKAAVASLNGAIGVAEANVRASGVSVEQTLIRAPFDGVVLTKNANVGDIITPFSSAADSKGAVVNMADMSTLEVEADVSEISLSKISVAQPVEIQLDAFPDLRLLGKVSRIVPTVDRSKATVLVKVEFVEKDKRVLPDMSAKVSFLSRELKAEERKPVTAAQAATIVKRDGKDVMFLIDNNIAKLTPVTVGAKVGDLMRVSGVKPGDKVVLNPSEKLKDGSAVVIAKK
ncbi:MAG: efflux RND transporter periplasmic adaptor subunit [Betaproteobacteria bacterium]|nr:efflux RND transporter periplasmic adaptor subunit [Betaproteobacteria bacterium]